MSRPTLTAAFSIATGLSPISPSFPTGSRFITARPGPRSLAATDGVSIDVLSSGYLDVSVPRVRSFNPMCSGQKYLVHPTIDCRAVNSRMSGGLPHSEIPGSKGALASPGLIAECHVLHRLLSPRHPPNALFALDPIQKRKDLNPSLPIGSHTFLSKPTTCVRSFELRSVH